MKRPGETVSPLNKKELLGTLDAEKSKLFGDNEKIVADSIFQKIIFSIEAGWKKLDHKSKEKALAVFGELLAAIKNYHESYRAVKGISNFKLSDTANAEIRKRNLDYTAELDRRERQLHEAFLDSVNILSRRMKELGLDNSWRADDLIYPHQKDHEANREKAKRWMFRVFDE